MTLDRYLREQKTKLTEARVHQIASNLAQGLEFLHEHGIILRNL